MEYRFYQEDENENNIILMVEWQTQERLAAYQNSDQYKILMGAISLLCESSEMKNRLGADRAASLTPSPAQISWVEDNEGGTMLPDSLDILWQRTGTTGTSTDSEPGIAA